MIITGMADFQNVCKRALRQWYMEHMADDAKDSIDLQDDFEVYVVWSCKILQNYKCLVSTTVAGDGIYAEYTYNGDKQELYEDVYKKISNTCIVERLK